MLPAHNKLTSPVEFRRAVKSGARAGSRTVVVHYRDAAPQGGIVKNGTADITAEVAASGPRFGLVVSKAVGNAVVRHRTSRRLRHLCMDLIPLLPVTAEIVVRALPPAADATSEKLAKDMRKALERILQAELEKPGL